MKKRSYSLALKLALILEEYSESEIRESVALLRRHGRHSSLLNLASLDDPGEARSRDKRSLSKQGFLPFAESKVVGQLKESDPEKYNILSEFDMSIRSGQLLPTTDDIKRFANQIRKGFTIRKTRKDTVEALISILAEYPTEQLAKIVQVAATGFHSTGSDDYQKLAQFLMRTKEEE